MKKEKILKQTELTHLFWETLMGGSYRCWFMFSNEINYFTKVLYEFITVKISDTISTFAFLLPARLKHQ